MSTTILNDIKRQFQKGDVVLQLISINVGIHLLIGLAYVIVYLSGIGGPSSGEWFYRNVIENYFYLPSDLGKLAVRPWTIITYMFLHKGVFHLLFNMLMLYWFGRIVSELIPNRKIVSMYLWGGIIGGLIFVLAYNIFPAFSSMTQKPPILGASASVMAVVLASATLNPRGQIRLFLFGRIELQYVALVLILIDILTIPNNNPGGHIAHLGGAFMGWLFISQLRRGNDWAKPFEAIHRFVTKPFNRSKRPANKRRQREPRVAYRGNVAPKEAQYYSQKKQSSTSHAGPSAVASRTGYSRSFSQKYRDMSQEECMNAILEKIRRSGYDSLTKDEKSFLDNLSKDK
ncbi:MAG: rhomboid family intramembrane serine protease [Saprospiraceae bacterium]|nr:rhomboid family intramembrane serine protease [Saprospiraceae bacterium]